MQKGSSHDGWPAKLRPASGYCAGLTGRCHPVRWGILGTGYIAREFRDGANGSKTGLVMAVASRDPRRPELAKTFPDARIVDGYEALIADPEIDAIYIALPNVFHREWTIAAAQAGKHVLCEKPMALTAEDAEAMIVAAQEARTFLGEAFMYRFHPLVGRLLDVLRSNFIGDVRMIKASFGFAWPKFDPSHRLLDPNLGGGALLDLGGYVTTMAALIAGTRSGHGMPEPNAIRAVAHIGETGVDDRTSALLQFADGIIAEVSCSISVAQDNVLHILGTEGRLEVDHFWFGTGKAGGASAMRLFRPNATMESINVEEHGNLYSFQFEAANRAIREGRRDFSYPGLSQRDTLANARVIDRWRAEFDR